MSKIFFEELALPTPDEDLAVGSGSHAEQTSEMLVKLESWLQRERPDVVLVYGDTNSTLAATLAATKIHISVAHIEAGLRSFNRSMPEELNRLVADHCSDRLYAPTPAAMRNLTAENLGGRALQSGDVMRDSVMNYQRIAAGSSILDDLDLTSGKFGLLTLHRPATTVPEVLADTLAALADVAKSALPLVFPVHPRTRAAVSASGATIPRALTVIEPVSYLDMIRLIESARLVLTDSGGVQKEAAFLATPCITLRDETEWTETIDVGINRLVGHDTDRLQKALQSFLSDEGRNDDSISAAIDTHYGSGNAAEIIAQDVVQWVS